MNVSMSIAFGHSVVRLHSKEVIFHETKIAALDKYGNSMNREPL